jgi:hypothetical protein
MTAQQKIDPATPISAVLASALPALGAVHKNKKNPAFKSNYADLTAVLSAIAPVAEYGLWFRQVPVQIDGGVGIETIYVHESGQELSAGVTPVPVNKNDAQGLGSAISYGRRYGLMTAFGLSADDDDGNAAVRAAPRQESAVSPSPLVTDSEWALLVQLVDATGTDAGKVCKAHNIGSLKEMTRDQWAALKPILEKRLADKDKETADA